MNNAFHDPENYASDGNGAVVCRVSERTFFVDGIYVWIFPFYMEKYKILGGGDKAVVKPLYYIMVCFFYNFICTIS